MANIDKDRGGLSFSGRLAAADEACTYGPSVNGSCRDSHLSRCTSPTLSRRMRVGRNPPSFLWHAERAQSCDCLTQDHRGIHFRDEEASSMCCPRQGNKRGEIS